MQQPVPEYHLGPGEPRARDRTGMLRYSTSGTVIWASPHYGVNSGEWGEDTTGEERTHARLRYLAEYQSMMMRRLYGWCTSIFPHTHNQCPSDVPLDRLVLLDTV